MFNHINNTSELPTLKEIETSLFRELQDVFQDALLSVLETLDDWIMDNRDFKRFENREKQKTTLATMFGEVSINRRVKSLFMCKRENICFRQRFLNLFKLNR